MMSGRNGSRETVSVTLGENEGDREALADGDDEVDGELLLERDAENEFDHDDDNELVYDSDSVTEDEMLPVLEAERVDDTLVSSVEVRLDETL